MRPAHFLLFILVTGFGYFVVSTIGGWLVAQYKRRGLRRGEKVLMAFAVVAVVIIAISLIAKGSP